MGLGLLQYRMLYNDYGVLPPFSNGSYCNVIYRGPPLLILKTGESLFLIVTVIIITASTIMNIITTISITIITIITTRIITTYNILLLLV